MYNEEYSSRSYGMFSKAGNQACERLCNQTIKMIKGGRFGRLEKAVEYLRKRMEKVSKSHGEVFDTEVRECIYGAVSPAFRDNGWELDFWDL